MDKRKIEYGAVAEFNSPKELMEAAEKVRNAGYSRFDCHSPFPIHGMDKAMGLGQSKLGWIVLAGALSGCLGALLLQWWTSAIEYPLVISAKPLFSLPAFIPIMFELTILIGAFGAVFGMFALNQLPMLFHYLFYSDHFRKVTDDGFFLSIDATDLKYHSNHTKEFLQKVGADGVEVIFGEADFTDDVMEKAKAFAKQMKKFMPLVLAALFIAGCYQGRPSKKPPIHIVPNMDWQPRYEAQEASPFFADGAAMRPKVDGTVARGYLNEDQRYFEGREINGSLVRRVPVKIDKALLERGQERFDIYCAPCHSRVGDGRGLVVERGYPPPTTFHDDRLRNVEDGHIFDVITNGLRNMPSYKIQIPAADRWAIVAYVRALQRSQNARLSDIPESERAALQRGTE